MACLESTAALARKFREDAKQTSQPEYARMMMRAAEDLEAFVCERCIQSGRTACDRLAG